MSEVYKTFPGGLYFVTFTTIGWIDIFPHWRKSNVIKLRKQTAVY